ncbi:unnamed protein product [Sphagnum tenellum]
MYDPKNPGITLDMFTGKPISGSPQADSAQSANSTAAEMGSRANPMDTDAGPRAPMEQQPDGIREDPAAAAPATVLLVKNAPQEDDDMKTITSGSAPCRCNSSPSTKAPAAPLPDKAAAVRPRPSPDKAGSPQAQTTGNSNCCLRLPSCPRPGQLRPPRLELLLLGQDDVKAASRVRPIPSRPAAPEDEGRAINT